MQTYMKTRYLKPLALGWSIALALTACGDHHDASASTPAPAAATVANAKPATPTFDTADLDTTIDPCDDFNGFVNAKWVAANPIPDDRSAWGVYYQLMEKSLETQHDIVDAMDKGTASAKPGSIEQKIGLLYHSGMDEAAIEKAGIAPLAPTLAKIDALGSTRDIVGFLDDSLANGNAYVFGFSAGADFNDAKIQIGYAYEDGLGLPSKDYYTDPEQKDIRKAYVDYIARTLTLAGIAAGDAKTQADAVMAFETRLAAASLSPVERRAAENQYHFVSVAEADALMPHFSWERFFQAQGVTVDKGFSLTSPTFFKTLDSMLASTPPATWRAYLRFHAIDNASPYLSRNFQDNAFDFHDKTLSGQPQQAPRWKRVLETVNTGMGEALGQLYVARVFTPDAKRRASELIDNVRNALKARIEKVDWMSDRTKQQALEKWSKFLPKIGYPDTWRDWSGLEIVGDNYFANVEAANAFNHRYDLARIGKSTDRLEWSMTPQTVNAYYGFDDNTLNFPAAELQPPFFDPNGDDATNYGGIGGIIGHEATHAFDDHGSQFDGDGNHRNWWTKADREQFDARAAKLVEQFDAYTPLADRPDLHVNGKLTLGENIADLGGAAVAYDALQESLKKHPQDANARIDGYTQDQRFFLSWARVWRGSVREKQALIALNTATHALFALRAIAAPSNMASFASAFQCKPGARMVRDGDKRVRIW